MRTSIILVSLNVILLLLGTPGFGDPTGSCGCNTSSAPRAGETITVQLTVGDTPRSYLLYVPKGYNPGDAIPLIVAFHGWTDTASGMSRGSGLTKTADAYDFAVAFPEGINYPEAGRGWAFPGCNASPRVGDIDEFGRRPVCGIGNRYDCDTTTCPSELAQDQCTESAAYFGDDVNADPSCSLGQTECVMESNKNCNWCGCVDDEAFTRALVEDVSNRMCIDLARIYATGMSAGGMMTSWLIGRMHGVFAAYAPMSGTNPRDFFSLPPNDADISVMWIHGTRDSTVPHDGSQASDGYFYEAADAEVERVAGALGCGDTTLTPYLWDQDFVQAPSNAKLDCWHHECGEGMPHQIAYCLWDGGHNYPKQPSPRESALWGNRLMVDFFRDHIKGTPEEYVCEPPTEPPTSETGSIQGFVYLDGTRAKGGLVIAHDSDGGMQSVPISKAGKFTFRRIPVGSWELEASTSSCNSLRVPVEVTADSTIRQDLTITCP